MTRFKTCLAVLAALCLAGVQPVRADSSLASSASDSASSTVGSLSNSVRNSSNSSSTTTPVADGDYRIDEVAVLLDRPGTLRLKLQPLADGGDAQALFLILPQPTVDHGRLAVGQVVTARQRPYGVEFAARDDGQTFFLALHDDWLRELSAHAVAL